MDIVFVIFTLIALIALPVGLKFRHMARQHRAESGDGSGRSSRQNREAELACKTGATIAFGVLALALVLVATRMTVIVPSGKVGVPTAFSVYADAYLPEGQTTLIAPWKKVTYESIQVRNLDWDTGTGTELWGITADEIKLTLDVTVPFQIEPGAVALMLKRLGADWETKLRNWMRSGIYDTVGQFAWQTSSNSDRQAIAAAASTQIDAKLSQNLDRFGLGTIEQAIRVGQVQIRAIYLPERIEAANEEFAAAQKLQETERQLTKAAVERAKRREKEGTGYANLIKTLPQDVNAGQIAELLRAMADKQRAEAFMHAAKNPPKDGNVFLMMGEGSSPAPMIDTTRSTGSGPSQVAGN